MKKIISAILLSFAFLINSVCAEMPVSVDTKGKFRKTNIDIGAILPQIQKKGDFSEFTRGALFLKHWSADGDMNADYCKGQPTPIFAPSRSSTNPSTYEEVTGVVTPLIVSNRPRIPRGYYDDTGWHLNTGLLLEGASTNLLKRTDGTAYASGLWTGWNVITDSTGTVYKSNVLIPELTSIPGATSQRTRLVCGESESGTYFGLTSPTTANGTIVDGNTVSKSYYVRSQTGYVGTVVYQDIIRLNDQNDKKVIDYPISITLPVAGAGWSKYSRSRVVTNPTGNITKFEDYSGTVAGAVKVTSASHGRTTGWYCTISGTTNYNGSYTATNIDTNSFYITHAWSGDDATGLWTNPIDHLGNLWCNWTNTIGNNESVDIEIALPKIEIAAYSSSDIPTNTTALTRNVENLSYYAANNFPAVTGHSALSFDGQNASGDDYVSVANSATGNQWNGCTAYTIEAWVLIRSLGESGAGRIFDKNSTDNTGILLNVLSSSGNKVQILGCFDSVGPKSAVQLISLHEWQHIVGVWDGSYLKVYVNNSVGSGTSASGSPLDDSLIDVFIGNRLGNDRTFDGLIQSVRIYRNKALSAEEVTTAYNAGRYASQPVSGCTAEYLFTEGAGTTLADTVAGNNGTISGATWTGDTHSGTIVLSYCPIMMPNEQGASYKHLFICDTALGGAGVNVWRLLYDTNANNRPVFWSSSNSNTISCSPSNNYASTWSRHENHILIATWSTTPFVIAGLNSGNPIKMALFDNGTPIAYSSTYVPPVGALPSTFSIQSSTGQAAIYKFLGIWDHQFDMNEVTETTKLIQYNYN